MSENIALLSELPIKTKPGYSLAICLEKIDYVVLRAQKTLNPSFFKRLMGGISKDHARTVVAACNADLGAVVRQIDRIQQVAFECTEQEDMKIVQKGRAISGYCERLISLLLEWRNHATHFESNIYGSERELIDRTDKLLQINQTMERSVAALVD